MDTIKIELTGNGDPESIRAELLKVMPEAMEKARSLKAKTDVQILGLQAQCGISHRLLKWADQESNGIFQGVARDLAELITGGAMGTDEFKLALDLGRSSVQTYAMPNIQWSEKEGISSEVLEDARSFAPLLDLVEETRARLAACGFLEPNPYPAEHPGQLVSEALKRLNSFLHPDYIKVGIEPKRIAQHTIELCRFGFKSPNLKQILSDDRDHIDRLIRKAANTFADVRLSHYRAFICELLQVVSNHDPE